MPALHAADDVPTVAPPPTRHETLMTKPAAQAAYRHSYLSAYGPAEVIGEMYSGNEQLYRDLYHRLHAEVEPHLDAVLSAAVDTCADGTLLVRTADHGELLGAHGGLHQKWFNLYDEAARVPMFLARLGSPGGAPVEAATSHVDIVPTLLDAAGIDEFELAQRLAHRFSEVHTLPGRSLLPAVLGEGVDPGRPVFLMTRDNMMEGDTGASGFARRLGLSDNPPPELRIEVAADVATNFEAVVALVPSEVGGGEGHLWKLARTFDDPEVWSEPGVRQLASDVAGAATYRTEVLPDEWELYDLIDDPIEADNRATDGTVAAVFEYLSAQLDAVRGQVVRPRHRSWPYAIARTAQPVADVVAAFGEPS